MVNITPKKCLYCKDFIPTVRPSWWKRPLTASHYARLKYCNYACSSAYRNKIEAKWGRKTKKPDIEILNGLWSKTRSYKKMAEILNVSYASMKKWMGNQKVLKNPGLVRIPTEIGLSKRKINWTAIEIATKSGKVYDDRSNYYSSYYQKKKQDPEWVEKKRKYAREHGRRKRMKALLV